jgi:hypothetical protein
MTELNAIAALAIIGLSRMPSHGYSTPAVTGIPITLNWLRVFGRGRICLEGGQWLDFWRAKPDQLKFRFVGATNDWEPLLESDSNEIEP